MQTYVIRLEMAERPRKRGFTLIEVLVAISTLAILSAIAIPAWNLLVPDVQLGSAARQVATDLHSARRRAMAQYRRVRVVLSSATSYVLEREQTPGAGDYVVISGPKSLPEGITATTTGTVVFDTRGNGSNTTITLANSEGTQTAVTVQQAGSVDVQ